MKINKILLFLFLVAGISGCGKQKQPVLLDNPPAEIKLRTAGGATSPVLKPGESVVVVAEGWDKQGNRVAISPDWFVDPGAGRISKQAGDRVEFTLSPSYEGINVKISAEDRSREGVMFIRVEKY